jgi:hypothetical protein
VVAQPQAWEAEWVVWAAPAWVARVWVAAQAADMVAWVEVPAADMVVREKVGLVVAWALAVQAQPVRFPKTWFGGVRLLSKLC